MITVGISAVLSALGLALEWTESGPPLLRVALFAGAIIAGGWFIFPQGAARRAAVTANCVLRKAREI